MKNRLSTVPSGFNRSNCFSREELTPKVVQLLCNITHTMICFFYILSLLCGYLQYRHYPAEGGEICMFPVETNDVTSTPA